jgi:hypothetical protein
VKIRHHYRGSPWKFQCAFNLVPERVNKVRRELAVEGSSVLGLDIFGEALHQPLVLQTGKFIVTHGVWQELMGLVFD